VRAGGSLDNYIPLKLTQSGVMPVIFAMSLLSFPQLVAKFLVSKKYSDSVTYWSEKVLEWLDNPYISNGVTFIFIIAFSFFYLTVVFNTQELAENLQKQGGFVPGIRPGSETIIYLGSVISKITFVGSIFLGFVAILPIIIPLITGDQTLILGGTGILIVVSVVIETMRQIQAQLIMTSYEKY
jgi:preprotein translocase subunit SecY